MHRLHPLLPDIARLPVQDCSSAVQPTCRLESAPEEVLGYTRTHLGSHSTKMTPRLPDGLEARWEVLTEAGLVEIL